MLRRCGTFKLYNFGTGRRLFAVGEVRKRAQKRGLSDIVSLCDEALDADRETAKLERQWRKAKTIKEGARTNAAEVDNELDRVVGALLSQLRSEAVAFGGTPRGEAGDKIIGELFPDGAATIIHASYENELSIVEDMIRALKGELSSEVAGLHIEHYVTRLEVLAANFRDERGAGERCSEADGGKQGCWLRPASTHSRITSTTSRATTKKLDASLMGSNAPASSSSSDRRPTSS